MFSRVAIVNRGEAAVRFIHAVRELRAHGGWPTPLQTIALHTEGERTAMFTREADVAYNLGPASARPYLDQRLLAEALAATGADAVWVGWGFVAEDPTFAELCQRLGVTFIGPSPKAMRTLGDKIGAKQLAESVGVPVAPWSRGPVDDLDTALNHAQQIGYPLMLKASAGGGGRGIRVITSDAELANVFQRTREEAERAFGNGTVFLERLVTGARHVEVQVIADGRGTAWALGVRDCSVQRRNQKLIEESASPALSPAEADEVRAAAERLALAVDYCGAGTVEFLFHPGERSFSFLEVNTRLQVEHPVTEQTTGLDLVRLQLQVAAGVPLSGPRPAEFGHAVEARLNAEDPDRDFAPAPGRIARLRLPTGPGIRVDTGVAEGDVIPADFDSMIAKIIATGPDRQVALARLRRALAETTVVIEGGTTNKCFLIDLLDQPEVHGGALGATPDQPGGALGATPDQPGSLHGPESTIWADTGWIDRVRATGGLINHRHGGVALVAAAIEAYEIGAQLERLRFLTTAHGGRPQTRHDVSHHFDLRLRGEGYRVTVAQLGAHRYRVRVAATNPSAGSDELAGHPALDVELERLDQYAGRLTVAGRTFRVLTAAHGPDHLVEVDGVAHRVCLDEGGVLRAPAPALVVSMVVQPGDEVAAGAPVVVLESMKMETVLNAPFAGRVRELLATANDQVEAGAPLIRLEPMADPADGGAVPAGVAPGTQPAERLDLPRPVPPADPIERTRLLLADVRSLLLGYDLTPDDGRAAAATLTSGDGGLDDDLLGAELDVLRVFADLCDLTRNRPVAAEVTDERVHSPREHFHSYLHSLDVERDHLPKDFRDKLARVLAHYGVADLHRSPELEEAVFRVFLAQQRAPQHTPAVSALLERWLAAPVPPSGLDDAAREVLDRLILATQLRYPIIGDLARSVRFRWFEAPIVEASREQAYETVRERLAYLSAHPEAPDYRQRVDELVASPEPLVRFLGQRLCAGEDGHQPLLEVLARRHYREYGLSGLQVAQRNGRPMVTADYELDGVPRHLVSTAATLAELADLAEPLEAAAGDADRAAVTAIDLYLAWPEAPESADEAAAQLGAALAGLPVARRVRRLAVVLAAGSDGSRIQQFTFRPAAGEPVIVEDLLVRGLHPMVGRRLNLWRLRGFDLTRLPSPEGVLLYRAVAPNNDADQRLVALAQVRELTVVRDGNGTVASLPQAERAVASCMDAVRRARAAAGNAVRLDMNHVWIYIWPVIDAPLEQLTAMRRTIAPLTVGAGVEEVLAQGRLAGPDGTAVDAAARFSYQPGSGVVVNVTPPPTDQLEPLDDYAQKVLRSRRRGTVYPYELVPMLTRGGGSWTEYDLAEEPPAPGALGSISGPAEGSAAGPGEGSAGGGAPSTAAGYRPRLEPVDRPAGRNRAGIVVGIASVPSARYPEGIRRVVLAGDPTRALGAVAGPECARIIAALDLAAEHGLPVEWFALSSGARISMDSGTENMDWVARALRRIIEFTQAGGEINVVVTGINVGAQPYWNAEATMLMHTKGILVMTPDSAMVLTGKQSLDYSGGVSAEDNFGIGGYDRVMGPNGQAQYWAPDLAGAVDILFAHYEHSYAAPGELLVRPGASADPRDRDVCSWPHSAPDSDFTTIGDIFSSERNPERKKPFDIRTLMRAVADADHPTLERWAGMADAETSVVFDAHLGGHPVCLLGIESRGVPRRGFPPSDGPDAWTAGTLFPRSSKKTARAINAASGSRPLVVVANLSGFDGSPESMRMLQLEYGAEIGRAVVNFSGPIVFCVVSRYHGGAFVVFSKTLHDNMQVLAVAGSFASVIGGAPAAGVVFAGEVNARTAADPRVRELERRLAAAADLDRARLRTELAELRSAVRSEKLGEVAAEFDAVHSIERAVAVGSVDAVIQPHELRPKLIEAVERGLARAQP